MKIGVIGLGLIGGSIFKDLISLGYDVIGVSKSQSGKNIYKNYEFLRDCNLIFVCTPMSQTLDVLDDLQKYLKPETVVTDVCSLKRFVSSKDYSYNFVPSHPMAGTENKGFENSFEGLFKGAKWVITKEDAQDNILVDIIKELGAIPIFTTPEEHDKAAALISHMPMLMAQAIFKTAQDNKLALEIASSGFRDMTRLALSNTEMAEDMINMNYDNIEQAILKLYHSIGELTNKDYKNQIEYIKNERRKMFL